jgi:hypothetical protein
MNIRNMFRGGGNTVEIGGLRLPRYVRKSDGGTLDLASAGAAKNIKKIVIDLQRSNDALAKRDLRQWREANRMAIDVNQPKRWYLYDIYHDVDLDLHLSGCVGQLQGFIMSKSFKLTRPDGEPDRDAQKIFDAEWFKRLEHYILEARYWGHSLIELGDVITKSDGTRTFRDVTLIPRKHVVPEYHRVVKCVGDLWQSGIDYHEKPYSDWLIEAGAPDDLGLYLKAAIETIPKKHALAFWDSFAEMFGLPIRVAKTSSRSQQDIDDLGRMLDTMGSKAWAVLPADSELELKESSRGDAFNVYDQRIERANTELSKLVLQNTMTIDNGSSLSQSQTHLKALENLVWQIADGLRDVVNNQLIPKMAKLGFPVQGLTFDWDEAYDYTPEQQVAYESMILNNFNVDKSYFEDKYGIGIKDRRQGMALARPDSFTRSDGGRDFFD